MTTASNYLVQRLFDWGVRRVYGYPGDGINGVMGALNREKEKVEFIQARHEEEAAFMACAHAKLPDRKHGTTFTGLGFSRPDVVPNRDDLHRAAEVLNAGKKVAILVGARALGTGEEVAIAADRLGAGVAKALLGKAVLPDKLPFVTGDPNLGGIVKQSAKQMMSTLLSRDEK